MGLAAHFYFMADTIVTNTPATSDSGAGWVVALIIIIAVAVGGFALYQNGFFRGAASDATNINVIMPIPIPDTGTPAR